MILPALPTWLQWLLLLAVVWLYIQVYSLLGQVATARTPFRNRQELETAYTKGAINRDEYERLKDRLG